MADPLVVLIVDNDPLALESILEIVRQEGYDIESRETIEQALTSISNTEYGLVVAETEIDGNRNLEFAKQIRETTPDLPLILVSDAPTLDSAMQAIDLGVNAYLTKPVEAGVFLPHVRQAASALQLKTMIEKSRGDILHWVSELEESERTLRRLAKTKPAEAINYFTTVTLKNVVTTLGNLRLVHEMQTMSGTERSLKLAHITVALLETIDVLKNTKAAFKSRDLGIIRKKLEHLLKDSEVKRLASEQETAESS